MKLELGCGKNKKQGYYGLDIFPYPCVDKTVDIEKGLPFKDNSIEEVYTCDFLEHTNNFHFIMEEIYRVCKPNALVKIRVPHFSSKAAFFEYHKRFFTYSSFALMEKKEEMIYNHDLNFKIVNRKLLFFKKWYFPWNYLLEFFFNLLFRLDQRFHVLYEETSLRNLFPAFEVYFELKTIKKSNPDPK